MQAIFSISWRISQAIAWLCCAALAFVTLAICYDVTIRNLGMQPPRWTIPVTEFLLLYIGVLGAPYMVRTKGHILVEAVIENVPERVHRIMARVVYLVCIALCLILAWYGGKLAWESWVTNDMDYRSIDVPRWLADGTIPIGFGLSAVEFLRLLLGHDSLYKVAALDKDGF